MSEYSAIAIRGFQESLQLADKSTGCRLRQIEVSACVWVSSIQARELSIEGCWERGNGGGLRVGRPLFFSQTSSRSTARCWGASIPMRTLFFPVSRTVKTMWSPTQSLCPVLRVRTNICVTSFKLETTYREILPRVGGNPLPAYL